MNNNTLILIVVGGVVLYMVMQNQQQLQPTQGTVTMNPGGGGSDVAHIIGEGLGFINNVFDSLKSTSVPQTQPRSI